MCLLMLSIISFGSIASVTTRIMNATNLTACIKTSIKTFATHYESQADSVAEDCLIPGQILVMERGKLVSAYVKPIGGKQQSCYIPTQWGRGISTGVFVVERCPDPKDCEGRYCRVRRTSWKELGEITKQLRRKMEEAKSSK